MNLARRVTEPDHYYQCCNSYYMHEEHSAGQKPVSVPTQTFPPPPVPGRDSHNRSGQSRSVGTHAPFTQTYVLHGLQMVVQPIFFGLGPGHEDVVTMSTESAVSGNDSFISSRPCAFTVTIFTLSRTVNRLIQIT